MPNIVLPAIAMAPMDQTACAPGIFTGQVTATPAGGTDYAVRWFRGQFAPSSHPADPPDFGPFDPVVVSTISNLSKGFYTAFVVNNDNGCEAQNEAFVDSITVVPVLDPIIATDMMSCATPDGTATATVVAGITAGFDFYWFDGIVGAPSPDTTGNDFKGSLYAPARP